MLRHLMAIACLCGVCLSAGASPLPGDYMSGEWTGAYFCYPDPIRIDASLATTEGRVSGRVRLTALRSGVLTHGEYTVSGRFDASLRHLVLTPEDWVQKQGNQTFLLGFDGVIDDSKAHIGGNVVTTGARANLNCSAFVLGRRKDAEDLMEQVIVPLQRFTRNTALSGTFAKFRRNDCDRFTAWFSRLANAYPDVAARRYNGDHVALMNLFDDEYFAKFFDDPFPELRNKDRQRLADGISACIRENRNMFNEYAGLQQVFVTAGQFSSPEISVGALARRAVRAWQRRMSSELKEMSATEETLAALVRLTGVVSNQLTRVWPDQRAETEDLVNATLTRVAEPVLTRSLSSAIQAAGTREGSLALARWESNQQSGLGYVSAAVRSGYSQRIAEKVDQVLEAQLSADLASAKGLDGARALTRWNNTNRELLAVASPRFRSDLNARVDGRLSELLRESLTDDATALAGVGSGMAGLAAGARWYREFNGRYEFAANRTEVRSLLSMFWQNRSEALKAVEPTVALQLLDASTQRAVGEVVSTALALPPDRNTDAGKRILALAAARGYQIRRDAVIGEPPAVDVGVCGPGGPPPSARAPCEYEIYDAIWRRFNVVNQAIRRTREGCEAREFRNPDNPLYAMACLGLWFGTSGFEGRDMSATLTNLQKLGCQRREGYSGYLCEYIIGMRVNNNAAFDVLAQIPGMRQAIEGGGRTSAYFEYVAPGVWRYYE